MLRIFQQGIGVFAFLTVVILFPLMISSCGQDENPVADSPILEESADWQIKIVNDEPVVTFENDATVQGWQEYRNAIKEHFAAGELENLTVVVTKAHREQAGQLQGDIRFRVWPTRYQLRFSAESNMLYGCINRRVPHIGIMISRLYVHQPIVNIHFAAWSENGKPCVGIYNSGGKGRFCVKICGPSYRQIRNAMAAALVTAGVSYAAA